MLADPRYTLTDLYFLFCIKLDGKSAIKHLTSGARQWYALMASLLFEGIIRGAVEVYKENEKFYVRLANNRKVELRQTHSISDDDLVNKMLWFLRKQSPPYLLTNFLSQGWGILYPTRKVQDHLVSKSILEKRTKKRLFGLWNSTTYPVLNTALHTSLHTKAQALFTRTDESAPTIQEIVFLSLIRGSYILPVLFPGITISNETIQDIIRERTDLLRASLHARQQSDTNSDSSMDIALPASQEIINTLLDDDERFEMLTASLDIMIDSIAIAMEGVDSFGDAGGDGGGDGGGGDGGGGGGGGE